MTSDTTYAWGVRSHVSSAGGASKPTDWANATFSTALIEQSDWDGALWVSLGAETAGANQYASQMRKVFTLPVTGPVTKATVFLALPGYGVPFSFSCSCSCSCAYACACACVCVSSCSCWSWSSSSSSPSSSTGFGIGYGMFGLYFSGSLRLTQHNFRMC